MKLRMIVIAIALTLLFVGNASAVTYTVDDGGGKDFLTIQDAVNAAEGGDTIEVYSGIYHENIIINDELYVVSTDGPAATEIVSASFAEHVILIDVPHGYAGTISGFTIIGTNTKQTAGICVNEESRYGKFSNNVIKNCYYGILLHPATLATISDNQLLENNYGVSAIRESGYHVIDDNVVDKNDIGIHLDIYGW